MKVHIQKAFTVLSLALCLAISPPIAAMASQSSLIPEHGGGGKPRDPSDKNYCIDITKGNSDTLSGLIDCRYYVNAHSESYPYDSDSNLQSQYYSDTFGTDLDDNLSLYGVEITSSSGHLIGAGVYFIAIDNDPASTKSGQSITIATGTKEFNGNYNYSHSYAVPVFTQANFLSKMSGFINSDTTGEPTYCSFSPFAINLHAKYYSKYTLFQTNIPIFRNYSSLANYLQTGDKSGMDNNPDDFDWNTGHDFTDDTWTEGIPSPEVRNVTHNGFILSNRDDYFVEFICKSQMQGLKIEKFKSGLTTGYRIVPDETVINSYNYNFTQDNEAVSQDTVDIQARYGIDNFGKLYDDLVTYARRYPLEKLSGYTALCKLSNADPALVLYKKGANALINMSQTQRTDTMRYLNNCITTWYIRYYDKDAHYGKWKSFTLRGGKYSSSTLLPEDEIIDTEFDYDDEDGSIKIDGDGNPIPDDVIRRRQNRDGTPDYDYDYGIDYNKNFELTDFLETLKKLSAGIGVFPQLTSQVFGFLPNWVTGIISVAVTCVVLLRFLGR